MMTAANSTITQRWRKIEQHGRDSLSARTTGQLAVRMRLRTRHDSVYVSTTMYSMERNSANDEHEGQPRPCKSSSSKPAGHQGKSYASPAAALTAPGLRIPVVKEVAQGRIIIMRRIPMLAGIVLAGLCAAT